MPKSSALEWTTRLQQLLGRERQLLVELVLALADFDRQRGYLELGYSSLWDYVHRALGQSETMTHYRVRAARFVQRFPQAVEPLRAGRLCITTLATLAPVVTEANCDAVLAEAMEKPKREVERIKARLAPKPVPKDLVRKAPAPLPGKVAASPVQVEMLTEELARRHLTTDREFEDLLARARSALSHTMPGASELEILKQGLRCIIRDHEKRKGLTERPRPPKQPAASPSLDAAIPRSVMRAVWQRDQSRCQWPTQDGGICGSRVRVQFHHVIDRGRGGPSTEDNLILSCAVHNQYAADQTWGRELMEKFRRARRSQESSDRSASPSSAGGAMAAAREHLPETG
ncbi:MAG TPA: HNH endonuclease signature motif containing protein [Polyangia bacterium]|nr:HNH endonuclease signature motif containing protein [Polyangia bacterium]